MSLLHSYPNETYGPLFERRPTGDSAEPGVRAPDGAGGAAHPAPAGGGVPAAKKKRRYPLRPGTEPEEPPKNPHIRKKRDPRGAAFRKKVHLREGRLDRDWDWSRSMAEFPINKDRAIGFDVRALNRLVFADQLLEAGLITRFQRSKYLDCKVSMIEQTDGIHRWASPSGTCGLEWCSVCVIHRDHERAKKSWKGMGGWGTLVTPVFTLPEVLVDRVDRKDVQADLERICSYVMLRYILMRDGLEGQGWENGGRWDWDTSGDQSPGRYRPHLNGTIPAYLVRSRFRGRSLPAFVSSSGDPAPEVLVPEKWSEIRTYDPTVDVDAVRELYRLALTLYLAHLERPCRVECRLCGCAAWKGFTRVPRYADTVLPEVELVQAWEDQVGTDPCGARSRIESVNFWTQYARELPRKRHWVRYGVMHVVDELTFDGMTKEEMDRTLDPRVWTMARRGNMTGWMAARAGWSVEDIRIAAAKAGYWKDVVLEPSFQVVKGGYTSESSETSVWDGFKNGDPAAIAELKRRRGVGDDPFRPEGAVISTTGSSRPIREPGQDEDLWKPTKAHGFCPVCGMKSISARVYTLENSPRYAKLKSGVWVPEEMLDEYRAEIAARRRQKEERRHAARLYRIAAKASTSPHPKAI